MKLTIAPLTPDRWSDLEAIFNARGCSVARGCWCMAYRLTGSPDPPPGMTRAKANRARLFYEAIGGEVVGERTERLGRHQFAQVAYGWHDLTTLVIPD